MLKYGILLMLITVGAYCDLLSEAGDFFTKHFTDIKSLFAKDEKQLQQSVDRVKDLLATIQDKMSMLQPLANDMQKTTLGKIGDLISQVNSFRETMSNPKMDFTNKENKWEELLKKIFVTEGLNKVIPLLQKLKNSAPTTFATYLFTCIVPVLINTLRE
uniref:Microfilariae surface-associated protein n=1 Tax=Onchocerca volvulus TaxID=6282 RepID=Q99099_ONCVO|nr:microfilariae surface-associated protein [Onchocerca volvulus]